MEQHIVKDMPYSELVKLVKRLEAELVNPDYAENDPSKKSHILNRLCYESGLPAATHTPESYSVNTECWLLWAGLATTDVIKDDELKNYFITVNLYSGLDGSTNTLEYSLNQLNKTATYVGDKLVGCKYTIDVGYPEFQKAAVYIIYDYEAYNSAVYDYQSPEFSSNGIYLCKGDYDNISTDGRNYSNTTTVTRLDRISTYKIHRLPNKFIDLLAHKDFKALKEKVEENRVDPANFNGWKFEPEKISMVDWDSGESKIDITSQCVHVNRAGNEVNAYFPDRSGTMLINTDLNEFREELGEELVGVVGGINTRLNALEEGGSGGKLYHHSFSVNYLDIDGSGIHLNLKVSCYSHSATQLTGYDLFRNIALNTISYYGYTVDKKYVMYSSYIENEGDTIISFCPTIKCLTDGDEYEAYLTEDNTPSPDGYVITEVGNIGGGSSKLYKHTTIYSYPFSGGMINLEATFYCRSQTQLSGAELADAIAKGSIQGFAFDGTLKLPILTISSTTNNTITSLRLIILSKDFTSNEVDVDMQILEENLEDYFITEV